MKWIVLVFCVLLQACLNQSDQHRASRPEPRMRLGKRLPAPRFVNCEIRGRITNRAGRPIVGASIILLDPWSLGADTKSAPDIAKLPNKDIHISSLEGSFTLSNITPGWCRLEIRSYNKKYARYLSEPILLEAGRVRQERILMQESRGLLIEVRDNQGKALPKASIALTEIDPNPFRSKLDRFERILLFRSLEQTNELGQVFFKELELDAYLLSVSAEGYESYSAKLSLEEDQSETYLVVVLSKRN